MFSKSFQKIAVIYKRRIFPFVKGVKGASRLAELLVKLSTIDIKRYPYPNYTVMDKKWDYLIILDACRYDLFKEVTNLSGYIISVGSYTTEWVKNTFKKDFYDLVYVSANPFVSNYWLKKKLLGRNPFFHLEEVWKCGWNEKLKTVPPNVVRRVTLRLAKEYPNKRMIIHFMQPHHPFIGKKKIILDGCTGMKVQVETGRVPNGKDVWTFLEHGLLKKEEVGEAYKSNLELVWKEVKKLAKKLKGRVVVTSDHGNCFGEYGIYGHIPGIRVEELVKVPWAVLKDSR